MNVFWGVEHGCGWFRTGPQVLRYIESCSDRQPCLHTRIANGSAPTKKRPSSSVASQRKQRAREYDSDQRGGAPVGSGVNFDEPSASFSRSQPPICFLQFGWQRPAKYHCFGFAFSPLCCSHGAQGLREVPRFPPADRFYSYPRYFRTCSSPEYMFVNPRGQKPTGSCEGRSSMHCYLPTY